jgi:hypothetical protein
MINNIAILSGVIMCFPSPILHIIQSKSFIILFSQPPSQNPFAEDVAAEELQLKIEENARLQREVRMN